MKSLFYNIHIHDQIYRYCIDHGECRELEQMIATNVGVSYLYAKDVIDRRFGFGEGLICNNTIFAYNYSANVVKDRWPKGEYAINKDQFFRKLYGQFLESL